MDERGRWNLNILMVSPFLPYPGVPHAGGKLVFHLLRSLSCQHSIFLLSRCFPGEERNLPLLESMLKGIEVIPASGPANFKSFRFICRTAWSYYQLSRKASEILKRHRFDVCHVEFTETGVFWKPKKGVPSVLSCHDIVAKPAYRRFLSARGLSRVSHWCMWRVQRSMENHSVRKFQRVFTLSEDDLEWAKRLYPEGTFRMLRYPGGIDFVGLPRREVAGRILFVGAMNRPQNIASVRYFLDKIWPTVRKEMPNAEFWVVGGGIPVPLKEELFGDDRITITGFVDRIEEYYQTAAVFVAPILEGGGIIVKILDALAAGVPVVTTTYGNEGIGSRQGHEIIVADDPEDFASSVVLLLRDEKLRNSLGSAGKQYVERNFSGDLLAATVEEAYKEISLIPPV